MEHRMVFGYFGKLARLSAHSGEIRRTQLLPTHGNPRIDLVSRPPVHPITASFALSAPFGPKDPPAVRLSRY